MFASWSSGTIYQYNAVTDALVVLQTWDVTRRQVRSSQNSPICLIVPLMLLYLRLELLNLLDRESSSLGDRLAR